MKLSPLVVLFQMLALYLFNSLLIVSIVLLNHVRRNLIASSEKPCFECQA